MPKHWLTGARLTCRRALPMVHPARGWARMDGHGDDTGTLRRLVLASMVLFRMAMAACTSWMTGDRLVQRYLWCLPLSDLLSFAIYIASYLGNTIVWRGETFKLLPGGKMVRIGSER